MGCDPPRLVCGRSVFRGRPGCRGLAAGSVREPAAKHLRDDGLTRAGAGLSGGSWDRLLGLRLGFNRSERLIAQFTEDVVGAAAEFAGDREAGPVVVDPAGDLEVIVVVRRAAARGLVGGLEQRPTQQLGTLLSEVACCRP